MARSDEPRSAISIGWQKATQVSSIGMEFVVPILVGVVVDRYCGTSPWATLAGVPVGFVVAMMHLMRIARDRSGP